MDLEVYKALDERGVYINYAAEHYGDGTNLNFSIEFRDYDIQTGWYNDNHEFGGSYETMVASVKLANWYLENSKRIELINSGYHDREYIIYKDELKNFLETLYIQ
jgi:hypothetical protein